MSLPADFDVRDIDRGEYLWLRVFAALERIYPARKLPKGRISCLEALRRHDLARGVGGGP